MNPVYTCMVMAPSAYLFLCLVLFLSCAGYAGQADPDAQNIVKFLPGFQGPLPFHLETGYVGVGQFNEFQLFYYFVESEQNPSEDPLLLWLTGGPGCSGLSGLMFEIGPLTINKAKYNGSLPTLTLNNYSWTKVANIIFLDSPVGTGFSYARGIQDYEMGDIRTVKLAHQFLRKWLADHPQFLPSPIYICGDSYSGIPVPILTLDILSENEAGRVPPLNLKGYLLGNPVTDSRFDSNSKIPYAHGMGLVSDELFMVAKRNCKGDYINVENQDCAHVVGVVNECLSGINKGHILEPYCALVSSKPKLMRRDRRYFLEIFEEDLFPDFYCRYWANDHSVREALHIHKGTVRDWIRCNHDLNYTKEVSSAIGYHINITRRGYRALIYSGDHDVTCPFVGTQAWIRSLNYSIVDNWRAWFVDGQVGGYTRQYSNNLTFATVKGGGHTAPEYRPKECLNMLQKWLSYIPL